MLYTKISIEVLKRLKIQCVLFIYPVSIGRKLMSLWMGDAKIHELYTAACGLYVCWLTLRIGTILYNWIPQGTSVIVNKLKEWAYLVSAVLCGDKCSEC